ncbi:MAG: O-antigen ligase family protein [Pyrinomonadaceae bacterium MAG19_C2-C3]|nr:O-antigen ligase family protein [Pyrinomonadaceae bacterium MAG19_C2-C3]
MSSNAHQIYDVPLPDGGEWDEPRAPATARRRKRKEKKQETWLAKRGHMLSYAGLFLFSVLVYFRPYEFHPALGFLSTFAFWIALLTLIIFLPTQLALEGNLTVRPREVNCVLLLTLAAMLSIPLAIEPSLALETFTETFSKAVMIFIVMVNVLRTERRLKGIVYLSLAASFVLAFTALQDFLGGRTAVEGYRVAGAIGGMFGNPNDMALHLVTMIPLVIAFFVGTRNVFKKLFYFAFGVLLVGGTVVTYSRGGFLGMAATMIFLAWKYGGRLRFLIVPATAVMVLGGVLMMGSYASRLSTIMTPGGEASASARQNLLFRSIAASLRNPLFGVGIGNFSIISIHNQVSHNAYTEISSELGLPALVFYITMILTAFKGLRQIEREILESGDKKLYYWVTGMQASLLGYAVSSFFLSVAYQWYIYYLISYAVCLRRLHNERTRSVDIQVTPRRMKQAI